MQRSYILDTSAFRAISAATLAAASQEACLLVSPFCFWELLTHLEDEGQFDRVKGNLMTWCWKPPWHPKVNISLRTISATLPEAGLRRLSGLCLCAPASFYTTSGAESYEYDHRSITEVLTCQN